MASPSPSTSVVKLRTVCDICTSSKVKCDGKTPCSRCARKGFECHYRPFRHQKQATPQSLQDQMSKTLPTAPDGLFFFEEYERKTWSVFFTLYKKLLKGPHASCSTVWYNDKLSNMHRFLQSRADKSTLDRFNHWIEALNITISPISHAPIRQLPLVVDFPQLVDDLVNEAQTKQLAMIRISHTGEVTCNAYVYPRFGCAAQEFQTILDSSGGGFLPYGADIIARLVCREKDLATYIQMMSLNIDALGKPMSLPSTRSIPTQSFIHVQARPVDGTRFEASPCIVRSVYLEQIESQWVKSFYYTMVFEIGKPFRNGTSSAASPAVVSQISPPSASPTQQDDEFDVRESKRQQMFDDDLVGDSAWLDTLLGDLDDSVLHL